MIARGDSIGGAAIGDGGARMLPTEWTEPPPPAPLRPLRRHRARRFLARR